LKSGSLNLLEPSVPVQACNGIALAFFFLHYIKYQYTFYLPGQTKKYANDTDLRLFLSLHEKFLPHTVQHLDVNRCQGLFCCVVVVALTWKQTTASLLTKNVKWKLSKQKHRSLNCTAMTDRKSTYNNGVMFQKITAQDKTCLSMKQN